MEKLSLKRIFLSISLLFLFSGLWAQVPSIIEHIRLPLWAELDVYPGLENLTETELKALKENENGPGLYNDWAEGKFDFAIARIKETADFLVDGMVYGWEFSYTPSDKERGVEEFLEIVPIEKLDSTGGRLKYSSPWIDEENNRLNCWIDYTRSSFQIQNYYLWSSIQNPDIQGRGYGSIEDGFDGIKAAAADALKDAVRGYYRGKIRNKPKEITGSVLIRKLPVLGIDAGRYVINLDFFLECGKIKEYTQF